MHAPAMIVKLLGSNMPVVSLTMDKLQPQKIPTPSCVLSWSCSKTIPSVTSNMRAMMQGS